MSAPATITFKATAGGALEMLTAYEACLNACTSVRSGR